MSEQEEMQRRLDALHEDDNAPKPSVFGGNIMELTPVLEQRIIAFAEAWATHNPQFEVKEAKAHISRDEQGQPQESTGLGRRGLLASR